MKHELRQIASAFREYARSQQWASDEYCLLVKTIPDWGRIHLILAAKDFLGGGVDPWLAVMRFLGKYRFDDPDLVDAISLTLSTFAQIKRGGLHGIPDGYEDINDLVPSESAV